MKPDNQMKNKSEPILEKYINRVIHGDCVRVMRSMPGESVDFVLTDPPYLVGYRPRDGRRVLNDNSNNTWLKPAFAELFRVLRPDSFCVCFYGWPQIDKFMDAWKGAGFRPISHFVWTKPYSSKVGYTASHHAVAYLLAKGRPEKPDNPIRDVLDWEYTANTLHPTQKPVSGLLPLVDAFSSPGDVVLDPFCGSGSVAVSALESRRRFIAIETSHHYCQVAHKRLVKAAEIRAAQ